MIYAETVRGFSEGTLLEYRYDIMNFYKFLCTKFNLFEIGEITIEILSQIDVTILYDYIKYLTNIRKNSAKTRMRKIMVLKSYFKFLCNKIKLLNENPMLEIELPKVGKSLPIYLNLNESFDLLNAIKTNSLERYQRPQMFHRNYCIIMLFLNCGLRISELVNISIADISGDKLIITGKGNKERIVYLNKSCQTSIEKYIDYRNQIQDLHTNALFLSSKKTRISSHSIHYMVKKYIKIAGLDPLKYSAHKLRHTAATLMYKNGVDIRALQKILGHENISTTEIYTHVDDEKLREAAMMNPLSEFCLCEK